MVRNHRADTITGSGEHVVQFYDRDDDLARAVGDYLARAVRDGATAIVIATAAHRELFAAELAAAGISVTEARLDGTLVWLDAAGVMERYISDGRIDRDAFRAVVGGLIRQAGRDGREIRAYGEMVALLWDAGDVVGAIEVEKLWNELSGEFEFSLWCAYHSRTLAPHQHADALHEVCHLHTSVVEDATARFLAGADGPLAARRWVASVLAREPYRNGAPLMTAQLVVSELASNAVIHAGTPFSVSVRREDAAIRISVRDWNPLPPMPRDGAPAALSGRGLRLVGSVARRWGFESDPDGKTVWAELALE